MIVKWCKELYVVMGVIFVVNIISYYKRNGVFCRICLDDSCYKFDFLKDVFFYWVVDGVKVIE